MKETTSRSTRQSHLRWTLLGFGVGAVFMWLSLRGTDIQAVFATLTQTEPKVVLAVILSAAIFMLAKAVRWKIILLPAGRPSLNSLHSAVYIGTAANLVLAHSGEIVRATLVNRKEGIPSSAVLASVGMERLFDFITVATLLGFPLLFDDRLHESVAAAGGIALVAGIIGLTLMMLVMIPSPLRSGSVRLLIMLLPRAASTFITSQLRRSLVGLAVLQSPSLMLKVFALSLLQWSFIVAAVWFSLFSVGHEITVSMAIAIWALMVIGLTLPSSPAQLGTVQLAFTLGLAQSHLENETAFAASVVYTVGVNFTYMLVGFCCWILFSQWHLTRVSRVAK